MRRVHTRYHWLGRLLASDPGRKRFQQAGKATVSLISSVFTMLLIFRTLDNDLFTPVIVAGMVGMMGIMTVMDDTKRKKQVTTLLIGVSAASGITVGSLFASNAYAIGVLMVCIIFSAFYFSHYGSRYFSLGMIGFMTVYLSSFLGLSPHQFPWFYLAIAIGVMYAFLYNFIIFKDSAHVLRRSMRSYHIQANLTLNQLIKVIEDPEKNQSRRKNLEKNVRKLSEYARNVAGDLNEGDIKAIWPGLDVSQLQLYIFDTAMLVETLTDSIEELKLADGLTTAELRRFLIWVVKALRDADVLSQNYEKQNLQEAEQAVQGLRLVVKDLQADDQGWLYLVRRIESIANHVVEGAVTIQYSLIKETPADDHQTNQEHNEGKELDESKEEEVGLRPTTKKAFQALVAGSVSIVVGYLISPIQPYWVILTAFIVLLGTESIGRTYLKGFQRSLGTIFGAIIGFFLAKLLSGNTELEVVLLFIVVFLAFYLFSVSYTIMSLFITILIAFMYDILLGGISYQLLSARVMDTVVGAAIALGASMIIFPTRTKDKVAESFSGFLDELDPFVQDYVRRFREYVDIKSLSRNAFDIDMKLQAIKDAAQSLLQRPGAPDNAEIARRITVFTAINYYAKHLVASSYQKQFDYPPELEADFIYIQEKLKHNIDLLRKLMTGEEHHGTIYSMTIQRERVERIAPGGNEVQGDLIHHLYYVWKINKAIVRLAVEMGAKEV